MPWVVLWLWAVPMVVAVPLAWLVCGSRREFLWTLGSVAVVLALLLTILLMTH